MLEGPEVQPNEITTGWPAFRHQSQLGARLLEPRGLQLPMPDQLAAAAWLLYMQRQQQRGVLRHTSNNQSNQNNQRSNTTLETICEVFVSPYKSKQPR